MPTDFWKDQQRQIKREGGDRKDVNQIFFPYLLEKRRYKQSGCRCMAALCVFVLHQTSSTCSKKAQKCLPACLLVVKFKRGKWERRARTCPPETSCLRAKEQLPTAVWVKDFTAEAPWRVCMWGSLFSLLHTCESGLWIYHLSVFSPTVLHPHFVKRANALSFVWTDCNHERNRKKWQTVLKLCLHWTAFLLLPE